MEKRLHFRSTQDKRSAGRIWKHKGNNGWIQLVVYCLGTSWRAAGPLEWRPAQCPCRAGGGPTTCGMGATGMLPGCVWTLTPCQIFSAHPLRSLVPWLVVCSLERWCMRILNSSAILHSSRSHGENPTSLCKENTQSNWIQSPIRCTFVSIFYSFFERFVGQLYALSACSIGSAQHDSHTEISKKQEEARTVLLRDEYRDVKIIWESRKIIPVTCKMLGVLRRVASTVSGWWFKAGWGVWLHGCGRMVGFG